MRVLPILMLMGLAAAGGALGGCQKAGQASANAIAPALIATDMVTSNPHASPDRLPVGFFGSPDEVSRVAVVLAESDFITGQTISVNGGWYMT